MRQAFALAGLALLAGTALAATPSTPLALQVLAPATLSGNAPRDIAVRIANTGAAPVMVLPNLVRLRIEGWRAEYTPYPGPPVDPWGGAQALAPGAATSVEFRNAADRRGAWRLPPGHYRITALYEVPAALAPPAAIADPARVWRGRIESAPAMMRID